MNRNRKSYYSYRQRFIELKAITLIFLVLSKALPVLLDAVVRYYEHK